LHKFLDADPNAKSPMTKAILGASSEANIAQVRQDLKSEDREVIEENAEALTMAVLVPLVICGVDIWMREGIYADAPRENWMAVVNSSLTLSLGMGLGSALVSVMIYSAFFSSGNGLGDALGAAGTAIAFFTIGGIAGGIIGLLPEVSVAFADSAALYYSVPAMSVVISAGVIFTILDGS
jgi:hypothetical protein